MRFKVNGKIFLAGIGTLVGSVWALFYLRFLMSGTWMTVPVTFTFGVFGLSGLCGMVYAVIKE